MSIRLKLYSFAFFIAFLVLVVRLFYWQIYKGKELSIQARSQYESSHSIDAFRGEILASDGTWLAASSQGWLVYASLDKIDDDHNKIADQLSFLFVQEKDGEKAVLSEADRLKELLSRENSVWVPLKHRVNDEVKIQIEALGIKGIGFEPEEIRDYPEGSVAAHILGFVGKNAQGEDLGYFGLEGYYDLSLSGRPGFLSREADARGSPIFIEDSKKVSAIQGISLLTHLDKAIQITLEKKLKEGVEKYGAKSGTAIVMNPQDGRVLAMGSYPAYDQSSYWEYGDEFFINPAISSSFEPGSIFKVVVMASALDNGVVTPETKCEICGGPYKVDKYLIETWNRKYNKDSNMQDVIINSDNVGMVFVANKLGKEKLYDYLKLFGFEDKTEIDLQGEIAPKLREKSSWSDVDLATAAFGQGIATTPLQMVRAVSAIANKGILVKPNVVDQLIGENWKEDVNQKHEQRVISEGTAAQVTAMMVEAAKKGESKWTHQAGFKIAGKTGTAQIPISGHYDEEKTIASFIGFAPYDDPKFIMLVSLQEPESSQWASETAAPLWYAIARDLFLYFGIQPEK
ncbi:hypothetical protein A2686_03085 [Candidatus Woesebacteria bacterium RIFCSPHIGHO2_01_FULL_38_10]|nr:MAG: hypothetical protein A2686_03085 [Candidatus Woesebacteria bacterium RIFCSPHIGHO2_01_FULL_38_10]